MENVSREVKIYWPQEKEWFRGIIDNYHEEKGYHVQYYDGDDDWIQPHDSGMKFVDEEDENGGESGGDEVEELNKFKNSFTRSIRYGNEEDDPFHGRVDGDEYDLDKLEKDYLSKEKQISRPRNKHDDDENYLNGSKSHQHTPSRHRLDESDNDDDSMYSTNELNENTILLKGEIYGANNIPFDSLDESEGIFYRVLYVEGGNQSSMFRCKTPIYKSEISNNYEYPRWDEGIFRFEMVLPGDTPTMDFTNLGDIIISLYSQRTNGGSDFLGQVSFNIQDFVKIGTIIKSRTSDHECRLLKGSYVLVDRRGKLMGGGADIDINLRLEWKKRKVSTIIPQGRGPTGQKMSSNMSTSGNTKRSTSTTRPKSANSAGTGRSTSAGRNSQNPHTYRRERQQSLVAKENEAIRQRLDKIGPKSSAVRGADRAGVVRDAYRPSPPATSANSGGASNLKSRPMNSSNNDQDSRVPSISSSNLAKKPYSELLTIYEDLRRKVAAAQKDLQNQKLLTNKMKSQVEKHEALVERMKKIELQSRKGTQPSSRPSGKGVSPRGGNTPRGSGEEKSNNVSNGEEQMIPYTYTVEEILTRNGLSPNEEDLVDQVLRELVVEHSVLQENRIQLKNRETIATKKYQEVVKESTALREEIDEIVNLLRQNVHQAPKPNWNLHQPNHPNKLQSMKMEVRAVKGRKELAKICGPLHDDISNTMAQIAFLDQQIEKQKGLVDKIRYDADNWKLKLDDLHEENLAGKMKASINLMRSSIYRLRRQERISDIKSETDAIELEILRHNLNHQMLLAAGGGSSI